MYDPYKQQQYQYGYQNGYQPNQYQPQYQPNQYQQNPFGYQNEYQTLDQAQANNNSIIYPIITLLTFIGTLIVNYLIGTSIGGVYRMKVTPPGYFFAIWGVIYSLVGLMLIYLIFRRHWTNETHIWMILSNIFNALWIIFTSLDHFGAKVYLMFFALLMIVVCLLNVWRRILPQYYENQCIYLTIRNIIAFYLGWVSCATVLNFCMVLIYGFGVSQDTTAIIFWPVVVLVLAFMIGQAIQAGALNGFIGFFISATWAIIGVIIAVSDGKNDYPA